MARPKGLPKTGGRQAGTPNAITRQVKTAIEDAFNTLGGMDYLVQIGREQPGVFCALLGRVLPRSAMALQIDSPVSVRIVSYRDVD